MSEARAFGSGIRSAQGPRNQVASMPAAVPSRFAGLRGAAGVEKEMRVAKPDRLWLALCTFTCDTTLQSCLQPSVWGYRRAW